MLFKPYKNILEFYNTDRLVLPAIRDQIINTIFLGPAEESTQTMLDSQDHPFFDLWKSCINHFRYSFWETVRGQLLVVPDMMSCVPPLCNVIFPDEYVHYGRQIQLRGIVTRYFEQGFDANSEFSTQEMGAPEFANQAFVAPTSDIQPLMPSIIKAECFGEELAASKSEGDEEAQKFLAFRQVPLPEEFHYGATYYTGMGEALLRSGEAIAVKKEGIAVSGSGTELPATDGTGDAATESDETFSLREEYNNFHKLNVLYKYFLSRMQSQKTDAIRLTFTPRLVPGLPCLLLSRTGRHVLGLITSLSHNVSASGSSETIINVEYQYLYDDSTKRPVYVYRKRDAEQADLKKENKDVDGYMWKNYFILSNDFRDSYIGKKMYNDILCDEIPNSDYNMFATELKSSVKGDYSILGFPKRQYGTEIFEDEHLTAKQEIEVESPDIKVNIEDTQKSSFDVSEVSQVASSAKKFRNSIKSIYNGYQAAYSKDAYKKQFEIYPLKDFAEHMSDLGAERVEHTYHFQGVGEKVDWVGKVKTELDKRLASRKKFEEEAKLKEVEANAENVKIQNEKVAADIKTLENFFRNAISELPENIRKQYDIEKLLKENQSELLSMYAGKYDAKKSKLLTGLPDLAKNNLFKEIDKYQKQAKDKSNPYYQATNEDIKKEFSREEYKLSNEVKGKKQLSKKLEALKAAYTSITDEVQKKTIEDSIKEIEEQLKKSEDKVKQLVKGVVVSQEKQEEMKSGMATKEANYFSKNYDGFTTVGPFCIQKRNYFLKEYLPSIQHVDTEFREADLKFVKAKDVGNDIIKITHKIGKGPEKTEAIDPNDPAALQAYIDDTNANAPKQTVGDVKYGGNINYRKESSHAGNQDSLSIQDFVYYINNTLDYFSSYDKHLLTDKTNILFNSIINDLYTTLKVADKDQSNQIRINGELFSNMYIHFFTKEKTKDTNIIMTKIYEFIKTLDKKYIGIGDVETKLKVNRLLNTLAGNYPQFKLMEL